MTRFCLRLALATFTTLLVACSSAQFAASRVDQVYASRTPPEAIELFRSSQPAKHFIEIGAVSACCSSDANRMIEMLRKKASENGGDALVGLDLHASGGVTATVIRYQ